MKKPLTDQKKEALRLSCQTQLDIPKQTIRYLARVIDLKTSMEVFLTNTRSLNTLLFME